MRLIAEAWHSELYVQMASKKSQFSDIGIGSEQRWGSLDECPRRVTSGPSGHYHLNGCYRVRSGRSTTIFLNLKTDQQLSSISAIQTSLVSAI